MADRKTGGAAKSQKAFVWPSGVSTFPNQSAHRLGHDLKSFLGMHKLQVEEEADQRGSFTNGDADTCDRGLGEEEKNKSVS